MVMFVYGKHPVFLVLTLAILSNVFSIFMSGGGDIPVPSSLVLSMA